MMMMMMMMMMMISITSMMMMMMMMMMMVATTPYDVTVRVSSCTVHCPCRRSGASVHGVSVHPPRGQWRRLGCCAHRPDDAAVPAVGRCRRDRAAPGHHRGVRLNVGTAGGCYADHHRLRLLARRCEQHGARRRLALCRCVGQRGAAAVCVGGRLSRPRPSRERCARWRAWPARRGVYLYACAVHVLRLLLCDTPSPCPCRLSQVCVPSRTHPSLPRLASPSIH
jgi:hypothetical protein